MNDLLFTALIIALLYYFFYYLPQQKKLKIEQPIFDTKQTQTEPYTNPELAELQSKNQTLKEELKSKNKEYQQNLKQKDNQITKLQTEIRELAKRPLKPTNSKSIQTDSETELTQALDTLIKNVQAMNNSLC